MVYTVSVETPEDPITETWRWTTDQMTAYKGGEDRIPLTRYPKRSFSGSIEFDTEAKARRHMALMFQRHRSLLKLPLFQYQTKLKAPVAAGAAGVTVNAIRSDLRAGLAAVIIEGDTFEELVVDTVLAGSVTFTTNLVNDYSARAVLCPLTIVYSATGSGFMRRNPDDSASASFTYMEKDPWPPFVDPLNVQALTMYDGMPVLERRAIGTQFNHALDSGIRINDYLAGADVFSAWEQSQWAFPLRWLINRGLDPLEWHKWVSFADYIQGAYREFLLPTHREDLEIVTPAAGTEAVLTVKGDEYSQHYWGSDTFSRIAIESDAGRHYATVTGVASLLGDDQLTFDPPLPAGAGWATNQRVEFLLKVRNADDVITCTHYGFQTEVSMGLRTVA